MVDRGVRLSRSECTRTKRNDKLPFLTNENPDHDEAANLCACGCDLRLLRGGERVCPGIPPHWQKQQYSCRRSGTHRLLLGRSVSFL